MASKRGFMDGYKTYDSKAEGYGGPRQWRQAFNQRMGLDEARTAVGDDSPRGILGVGLGASWDEIKRAYRKLVRELRADLHHEDEARNERIRKVLGAYRMLEEEFGK